MLCTRCRRQLLTRLSAFNAIKATAHTVSSTSNAAPSTPPPPTTPSTPAPTPVQSSALTSISQPLSTPFFPSTSSAKPSSDAGQPKKIKPIQLQGSVPGGQELRGLAYLKAQPSILAKEDDEYPPWLWTLLSNTGLKSGEAAIDLSALTKKQRQRYEKKQEKLRANLPTPIPLHEQSKNLTNAGEDAKISLERRQELVKSARSARRKSIREDNFLRTM